MYNVPMVIFQRYKRQFKNIFHDFTHHNIPIVYKMIKIYHLGNCMVKCLQEESKLDVYINY
jgi:hypothetical protein